VVADETPSCGRVDRPNSTTKIANKVTSQELFSRDTNCTDSIEAPHDASARTTRVLVDRSQWWAVVSASDVGDTDIWEPSQGQSVQQTVGSELATDRFADGRDVALTVTAFPTGGVSC
jgi:hypothetical protein